MTNQIGTLANTFKVLFTFTASVAVFYYFAGFSFKAALLVGICFAETFIWLHRLSRIKTAFRPYKLVIGVNFQSVRDDLRLLTTDEKPFENFSFTALNDELYSRSDGSGYSSTIYFNTELPCPEIQWEDKIFSYLDHRYLRIVYHKI